jgi:S1-C subfamily serine protease
VDVPPDIRSELETGSEGVNGSKAGSGPAVNQPREGRRLRRLLALAVVVVTAGLTGAVVALLLDGRGRTEAVRTVVETTVQSTAQPSAALGLAGVAESGAPGVVSILATTTVEVPGTPFQPPTSEEGVVSGSGFVLDKQGHILTSEHIVGDATKIHVSFADGHKVHARLVGSDPLLDLAVLSVSVPEATLHPLELGSADDLQLGDPLVVIGDPFGLARSASVGVVSALHRQMVAPNGFTVSNAVQTDAAINHGSSGGPVLDARGRVVGVAAQIAESGVDANVGVGFAVPIDAATRSAIDVLKRSGTVRHAWLGVALDDIDAILGTSDRVQVATGALVTGVVADGPGASAGLVGGSEIATVDGADYCVGGDVITAIDGDEVTSVSDLQAALALLEPGDEITLAVVHADSSKDDLGLTLGTQPTSAPETTTGCR